jgi:hypothetical protein
VGMWETGLGCQGYSGADPGMTKKIRDGLHRTVGI